MGRLLSILRKGPFKKHPVHFSWGLRPSPSVLQLPRDLPHHCQVWCEIQTEIWPEDFVKVLNSCLGWCTGSMLDPGFCNVQLNHWADSVFCVGKGTQQGSCSWGWATYTSCLGGIQELKPKKHLKPAYCDFSCEIHGAPWTLECAGKGISAALVARLLWKVLLDVIFLELVRHLEFYLLCIIWNQLQFVSAFLTSAHTVINTCHWTVFLQIINLSGLCVLYFRVVNANNSAVNLSSLSFMFSFSVGF